VSVARGTTAGAVLLASARMQGRQTLSAPPTLVAGLVQPLALLVVVLNSAGRQGPAQAGALVVGVVLTAYWSSTVWGAAGILRRDRATGTLSRSVTGVQDARLVLLGKCAGSSGLAVVLVTAGVALALALLRPAVAYPEPGRVLVGLLLALASGTALGMVVSCVFVATRYGAQISSALMYPVFLLGGMLIPPDTIPLPLRWIPDAISFRWIQAYVAADPGTSNALAVGMAVVLTALYAAAGLVLFERLITRARRAATLDLV
jgi:ABC-2 type transport system permease protein